jgi:hypothetical protein
MESLIGMIVTFLQLALSGFVMWGGWLVLRDWFRGERVGATAANAVATPQAQANDFERVASLVLFALLCTTLAAAA